MLVTPPGFHHRLDHGGERDGEEDAPEAPQAAEDQHGDNQRDRVDVHRFGEYQRHDDVAVQYLHDEVEADHPVEIAGEAILHIGDDQHRDGDDGRTDVGDEDGEADHEAEQQAVLQVENVQRDEGEQPDDEDFAEFAADVVANLDVHFVPDVLDDFAPFRQKAAKPAHDELFILQKEEDEQRHEDDVHQHLDDDEDRVKQLAGKRFAEVGDFAVKAVQEALHAALAEGGGEFVRQQQDVFLGALEVVGQCADEQFRLVDDGGQQHDGEVEDGGDEDEIDEGDGNAATHADALQLANDAFEQVGKRDGDDDRQQPFAEEVEDGNEADAEGDQRDQRGVGEKAGEGRPEGFCGGVHEDSCRWKRAAILRDCAGSGADFRRVSLRRQTGYRLSTCTGLQAITP